MRKRAQWGILVALTIMLVMTLNMVARKRHERMRQLATVALLHESASPHLTVSRLKTLLEQGADINGHDSCGNTPLILLAATHDEEGVEKASLMHLLLGHGADPNTQNIDGNTPLILETWMPESPILSLLLSSGANPNTRNKKGESPLFIAVEQLNVTAGHLLLAKGANANQRNKQNQTPLMLIMNRIMSVEVNHEAAASLVSWLVAYGADSDANVRSFTPLMFTARYGDVQSVARILARVASIDEIQGPEGLTALYYAGWGDKPDNFLFLVKKGANINLLKNKKNDLLYSVLSNFDVSDSSLACVQLLLDHGADPNYAGEHEGAPTPLMIAASMGNVKGVTLLLKRGARVNTKLPENEYDQTTALEYATQAPNGKAQEITGILLKAGAKVVYHEPHPGV